MKIHTASHSDTDITKNPKKTEDTTVDSSQGIIVPTAIVSPQSLVSEQKEQLEKKVEKSETLEDLTAGISAYIALEGDSTLLRSGKNKQRSAEGSDAYDAKRKAGLWNASPLIDGSVSRKDMTPLSIEELAEKGTKLGEGQNGIVYKYGNYAYKVPTIDRGINDPKRTARLWNDYFKMKNAKLAKAQAIKIGSVVVLKTPYIKGRALDVGIPSGPPPPETKHLYTLCRS